LVKTWPVLSVCSFLLCDLLILGLKSTRYHVLRKCSIKYLYVLLKYKPTAYIETTLNRSVIYIVVVFSDHEIAWIRVFKVYHNTLCCWKGLPGRSFEHITTFRKSTKSDQEEACVLRTNLWFLGRQTQS